MPVSDEEPYSTIFASLNHPVRRKILRMLSQKPMSFSEMLEVLGVSSSFLTYHIENLGELVSKTDAGKYGLSSFGEAAMATMTKVEDIPVTAPQQQTKSRKVAGRSIAIVLGVACMILVASLVGAFAYYVPMVNSKNSTISSLNSQVSSLQNQTVSDNASMTNLRNQIDSLQSQITELQKNASSDNATIENLQDQLDLLLNWSSTIEDMIISNTSDWVNRTVIVQGNLEIGFFPTLEHPPYDLWLDFGNKMVGVASNGAVNFGNFTNHADVLIYGIVREGEITFTGGGSEATYYIEAELVETG